MEERSQLRMWTHAVRNDFFKGLQKVQENRSNRARGLTRDTRATTENVLDTRTCRLIEKLMKRNALTDVCGTISTGKEANVYFVAGPQALADAAAPSDKRETDSEAADLRQEAGAAAAQTKGVLSSVQLAKGGAEETEEDDAEAHPLSWRPFVLKVYRTSILAFQDRSQYVQGDHRFERAYTRCRNPRKMVVNWVMKEFRNLLRLHAAGVPCPLPVDVSAHVLLMTFIGFAADAPPVCAPEDAPPVSAAPDADDEAFAVRQRTTGFSTGARADDAAEAAADARPPADAQDAAAASTSAASLLYAAAPRLKDLVSAVCCSAAATASLRAWEALYVQAVALLRWLFQVCRVVHGDLSEYNLLFHVAGLYVIDVGQAVNFDHPQALDFLKRDCRNVTRFFRQQLAQIREKRARRLREELREAAFAAAAQAEAPPRAPSPCACVYARRAREHRDGHLPAQADPATPPSSPSSFKYTWQSPPAARGEAAEGGRPSSLSPHSSRRPRFPLLQYAAPAQACGAADDEGVKVLALRRLFELVVSPQLPEPVKALQRRLAAAALPPGEASAQLRGGEASSEEVAARAAAASSYRESACLATATHEAKQRDLILLAEALGQFLQAHEGPEDDEEEDEGEEAEGEEREAREKKALDFPSEDGGDEAGGASVSNSDDEEEEEVEDAVFLNTWIPSHLAQVCDRRLLERLLVQRTKDGLEGGTERPGGGEASKAGRGSKKSAKKSEKEQDDMLDELLEMHALLLGQEKKEKEEECEEEEAVDKEPSGRRGRRGKKQGEERRAKSKSHAGDREEKANAESDADTESASSSEASEDDDEEEGNGEREDGENGDESDQVFRGIIPDNIDRKTWKKMVKEQNREKRKYKIAKHLKKKYRSKAANR
ncbi:RIO1 family protein [Besnoitia besnoiti]|uniref:non-specific serine/threonine protein kinase n=1 Tax=Besnoitia besnoiti TaxID=94643 RepID=A0A2A9M518_BESBE|nr:RIO1 family protein [Besnoitia besnoiti]PFH32304.1 RIO1 family protein [Besnoitia besnoiti]